MRRLRPEQLLAELDRRHPFDEEALAAARAIVEDVRRRGDEALLEYTLRWDAPELTVADGLEIPAGRLRRALEALPAGRRRALETAARRIAAYHARLLPRDVQWTDEAGNRLGQLVRPLDRVGIYVPGGRAAYPSTVLMAAIPARLAGVREIVLVTPPRRDGSVPEIVLAAAALAGVDRVFRVGGAQAIAALAYGTESVPPVDKIVGPGNAFVTAAKALVAARVGIDALAGPSEIVIVADDSADPAWVAADLLAQAEHDPLAVAGCLSDSPALLDAVEAELDRRLAGAPRAAIAAAALERGFLVATRDVAEAVELANRIGPEHLSLHVRDAESWLPRVRAAGAVFAGPFSPVAAGDYAAGTNHILPTGGAARHQSGVSPETFVRRIPFFAGTPDGAAAWASAAALLADAEGLPAHAASVRIRQEVAEAGGNGPRAGQQADGDGGTSAMDGPFPPGPAGTASGGPATGYRMGPGNPAAGYTVAAGEAPVKLDANESSEPWPPELLAELREELERADPHRYPRPRLRDEVTALLEDYTGVPAASIVLGNGSDELVQAVLGVLGRHSAAAVAPSPTFGYYAVAAEAAGVPYHPVPVPPDRPFRPDSLLETLDTIPGDKIVFLCRPNNPTGLCCERELVGRLLARPDTWLVVDEAYVEFAGESVLDTGALPDRLVVLRTLSKAFALAGGRCGYAVAAPGLAARLRRWLQPYNLGTFALLAARVALRRREVFLRRVAEVRERRDELARALAALPGIEPVPSRTNFILFRVASRPDEPVPRAARVRDRLREEGIAVRYFDWEPSLRDYLRVTVGTAAENEAFLRALGRALEREPLEGGNGA
ncbi:MAG TPA: histidinol dehydrogenase [Thermaerobacter sp.]